VRFFFFIKFSFIFPKWASSPTGWILFHQSSSNIRLYAKFTWRRYQLRSFASAQQNVNEMIGRKSSIQAVLTTRKSKSYKRLITKAVRNFTITSNSTVTTTMWLNIVDTVIFMIIFPMFPLFQSNNSYRSFPIWSTQCTMYVPKRYYMRSYTLKTYLSKISMNTVSTLLSNISDFHINFHTKKKSPHGNVVLHSIFHHTSAAERPCHFRLMSTEWVLHSYQN